MVSDVTSPEGNANVVNVFVRVAGALFKAIFHFAVVE